MSSPEKTPMTRKPLRWVLAGALMLAAALLFSLVLLPFAVSKIIKGKLNDAGLNSPSLKVGSVGPFFTSLEDISFSTDSLTLSDATVESSYFPTDLILNGRMDSVTVDGAHVLVALDPVLSSPTSGDMSLVKIPFAIPAVLDAMPARKLLVRQGLLDINVGNQTRKIRVDALVSKPSTGVRSATVSASGDNGDQILLSVEGQGGRDTINAEGSVDLFGWLLACGDYIGFHLPNEVALEAAPLVFQLLLDQESGKPGKWVGVVSQPWFQYEKGPLIVAAEDMRAGITGDASGLTKAAAEGDVFIKTGSFSVGPFHPFFSATDSHAVDIRAGLVPIHNDNGSMSLDFVKGTAFLPEGEGDFSLRGSFKPNWFPQELDVSVSSPNSLDGVFVDIALPRHNIDVVQFPAGWLPSAIEGMQLGGSMDADIFLSAGGLTAGGFSASGRFSADDAFVSIPVASSVLEITGARVRNVRFSSLLNGFAVELPEGLKAGLVKMGAFSISDVQLWPGHLSAPGRASMGSMTATLFGGRLISGLIKGQIDEAGVFTPTASIEMTCSGADLAQLGTALPGSPSMSGNADFTISLHPRSDGIGMGSCDATGTLKSESMSFSIPASKLSVSAGTVDMTWNVGDEDGKGLVGRIATAKPLELKSFGLGAIHYDGKVLAEGWLQTSLLQILGSGISGVSEWLDSNLKITLSKGSATSDSTGLKAEGMDGVINVDMQGKTRCHVSAETIRMAKVSIGSMLLENLVMSAGYTPAENLTIKSARADFFGGTATLDNFSANEDGSYAISLKMENVSASKLMPSLFPKFKGSFEGHLDGVLSLMWKNGELIIYPCHVSINKSYPAKLSTSEAEKLIARMGEMNDMIRSRSENTLRNMIVKEFSLETRADLDAPVVIHLVGEGTSQDSIPVDLTLTLKGDIAESLQIPFGKQMKVRFANGAAKSK